MSERFWVYWKKGIVAVYDHETNAVDKAKDLAIRHAPDMFFVGKLVNMYKVSTQTNVEVVSCHDTIVSA